MSFARGLFVRRTGLLLCLCVSGNFLSAKGQTEHSIVSIERNKTDNTPVSITFSPDANLKPVQANEIFGKYLGTKGNTTMTLLYSTTTKMNITTDRYAEYFKGIKIEYASYSLMSKEGVVNYITGNYYNVDENTSAEPSISEAAAFNNALGYMGAQQYRWQDPAMEQFIKKHYHKDTSYLPHGQLEWIEDFNSGVADRKLHLAYAFDIYASKPLSRKVVYIDAHTGRVLYANPLIKHTAASGNSLYSGVVDFQSAYMGGTYELFDSTRGNGVHTLNMHNGTNYTAATEFTSSTNTWPASAADSQAIDAQWGASRIYDYWDSVQGRLSWDNMNGILEQYVHFSTNYDNAFWDGTEMTYGDGSGCGGGGFTSLVSLDVTSHEIGHGVCQATCNLIGGGEPGAINEGLSDCWGATIENWANPHETDAMPKKTWWMGEELGCGTPLRRIDSPKLMSLPDTYHGTYWFNLTGCAPSPFNDDCGVHTNMGVISKWYYLLTVGGAGTNDLGHTYSVAGQSFTVSQNVLYQTELILPSNTDYPILRANSISAATVLYGACSPEVKAVTDAWYAVGVGTIYDPCIPQISFVNTVSKVTENAHVNSCTASHVEMIPIKETGPLVVGGTPTATIVATDGTAVSGVDYLLTPTTFSFAPGDTTTKYIPVTIYDNGAVGNNKWFALSFILDSAGTTTITSPIAYKDSVVIVNDDHAPQLGGAQFHTVNTMTITSNHTSPFYCSANKAHSQFLLYPAELTAAGVLPNYPISQLTFHVTTKNSTQPYTNYNLSLGNTPATDLDTNFVTTGLTTVYSGNYTTYVGMDSFNFSSPFMWDGLSSVVVDVCFTNTSATTTNDQVDGYIGSVDACAYHATNASAGTGCGLIYDDSTVTSTAKPIMRFKQILTSDRVETTAAATRTWFVKLGQEVYFDALADTGVIMGLKTPSMDLGCVQTTLVAAGDGFVPFPFSPGVNRSVKEFSMTPAENAAATSYKAILYFTNTELGAAIPANLYIFKTDAATDADISSSNSVIASPTLISGASFTGFMGSFTGFSRFYLVDGPVPELGVATINNNNDAIQVDNNPFHDKIYVSYKATAGMNATISLCDVTGRIVYTAVTPLVYGNHKFTIDCSGLNLAPGMYIMQVGTAENVYTRKLIKN